MSPIEMEVMTMFTRKDLVSELARLTGTVTPPLEVVEFGSQDFITPSCEESIWAFRGSKRDFADGLLFWVKTLQAQGWEGRESYFLPYAQSGLCEPLTEAEFSRLVAEYGESLRVPLPTFLLHLDGFRSGLRMSADWNDVSAVAELNEVFVAFYWSTTA
jgi:hypothetical protein